MDLAFGTWLKRRRRVLDLTQDDLAKRAFCSVNTIRKIEAGDLKPSKSLAQELARVLALPPETHAEFIQFARTPDATAPENAFSHAPTPEPTAPPALRFQPPAPLTAAIGRERDTGVITRTLRLRATRLVTLTGPPGTGKTRLSLEVANEMQSEFAHGAAFVALAPVYESAQVESAIAQALDVREAERIGVAAALRGFLRDKELLLVLDNFEHVLGAAPLVNELLSAAPRLKALATSREPLRVYGERELPVAPLAVPPLTPVPDIRELESYAAVHLFVERAQAVKPEFELNETNAEAVARLCVGLDGLPLAIEMAAARVKWESPQNILPRLARRLETLGGGRRDLTARQQTLRGAMDWSYDLLDEREKGLLRHLGVFRGGFTSDAAEAVYGARVDSALQNLVEKSLVKREDESEGTPRYALLEMIREYALERLTAAGEFESARARHAAFYRARAHAIAHAREYGTLGEMPRFDPRDTENYRLALDWFVANDPRGGIELAADLYDFWSDTGRVTEGRAWLKKLAASEPTLPPDVRGLDAAAALALIQGDHDEALTLAERARALAEQRGLDAEVGKNLRTLGTLALYRGEFARAEELLLAARHIFQKIGLPAQEAHALNYLGLVAKDRGQLEEARAYHQAALELRRALGVPAAIAQSLLNLSIVEYWSGDYARTLAISDECIKLFYADGDRLNLSYVLENIGMAETRLQHYEQARHALQQAMGILQGIGDKRGMAMVWDSLGDVARAQGEWNTAHEYYCRGLELCAQTGEKRRAAFLLEDDAAVACQLGQARRAAKLLSAASTLRAAIGAPRYATGLGAYEMVVGQIEAALGEFEFEQAWGEGQKFSMEEAIEFALQNAM